MAVLNEPYYDTNIDLFLSHSPCIPLLSAIDLATMAMAGECMLKLQVNK